MATAVKVRTPREVDKEYRELNEQLHRTRQEASGSERKRPKTQGAAPWPTEGAGRAVSGAQAEAGDLERMRLVAANRPHPAAGRAALWL
jgi:hypothetical protein